MASNILAQMSVVLGAQTKDFEAGMAKARSALSGFKKAGEEMKGFGESFSKYVTAPLAALAGVSLKASGDLQALKKGLESVTGSAEGAEARFNQLKSSTKGLDISTVAQADVSLQASGVAAEKSLKSIQEFGNALKTVGKSGASDLKGALYGVQQLAATEFPMAEDLNIIKEAVPQVGKLLKEAFGTARSEELAKLGVSSEKVLDTILTGLEKLPRVVGGLNNSWEGFTASIKSGLATFGDAVNKTLNIEGLFGTFSEKITGLANAFSNLSPATQKFIIIGAALAAAIGPILFGVGALAAAIPTLAAGFAILTGPVGLVAAGLTALALAALKTFTSVKSTSKSFDEQKKHVADLNKSFVPLVDRYEELRAKSSLSKDEQTELNSIIAQIAKTAPDTISAFDKYGKALDISSAKARDFVKTQQAIAGLKNKELIQEQVAEFKKLDKELDKLQAKFAKGVQIEYKQIETARGVSSEKTERELTNAEKQELGFQIQQIRDKQNALRMYVRELNGLPPLIKASGDAAVESSTKIAGLSDEQIKAIAEIKTALAQAANEYKIHGDAQKYAADKAGILESGWKSLLKVGLDPQSVTVQNLAREWKELTASLDGYAKKGEEIKTIDPASSLAGPMSIPVELKPLPVNIAAFETALTPALEIVNNFAATASGMINGLIADSFVLLGESIGAALSGGNGAQSFFNGFLVMLADFAGQFGKLLITTALAASGLMATISNPAAWPLALAAGIALTAAAGIAKGFLAKGMGGGPAPSAPQSSSPSYGSPGSGKGYGMNGMDLRATVTGDELQFVLTRREYKAKRFGG